MKNYTEARAKLAERFTAEQTALAMEERIMALLPTDLQALPFSFHVHTLYGTVAGLNVKHNFYDYGNKAIQPTLATVRRLAETFPAVEPLIKVKDGCLSFRTQSHVEALPEAKKERWESETVCAPFLLKVSGFQQRTYTIEWVARLADMLVRMSVELPLPFGADNRIGVLDIQYKDYKDGRRVERCTFRAAGNLIDIFKDDEAVAQLQTPIKWGKGSEDTPNDFTIYWIPNRDWNTDPNYRPSVLDLVAAIEAPALAGKE